MTPPPNRSWLRRALNRLEVDRAVFFSVAARGWQLLTGPIVIILVARFFSPETQGYHFTFSKLLALQAFVELGLRVVLLNAAGHEWASLSLDPDGRIAGDSAARARLVALGRIGVAWFGAASVAFALAVGGAGVGFFSNAPPSDVDWFAPWLALVAITALQMEFIPLLALLDGCGQMPVVYRYRLGQAMTATLAAGACVVAGGGLWTGPVVAAVRLLWDVAVVIRYRRFFTPFLLPAEGSSLRWREEILPLQWRIAVQSLFIWFACSLFEPVLFRTAGAAEAGRFGMTWAALAAAQAGALAWVDTRVPRFSLLVARGEFDELDRVFFRVTGVGFRLLVPVFAAFAALVQALDMSGSVYANRLLPLSTTLLLSVALLANYLTQAMNHYLRAHRREPAFVANLMTNLLSGLAVALGGRFAGSQGAAAGYCAVQTLVGLPWCFLVWRRWRTRRSAVG